MSTRVTTSKTLMYETLLMKSYADFVALLISHPAPREAFFPIGYLTSSIGTAHPLLSTQPVHPA